MCNCRNNNNNNNLSGIVSAQAYSNKASLVNKSLTNQKLLMPELLKISESSPKIISYNSANSAKTAETGSSLPSWVLPLGAVAVAGIILYTII